MNADQSSMVSRKDAKIAKKNTKLGPKMNENEIGRIIVDAAVALRRELGPGLLESVYEAILARELADRGLKVERQISIPITWRGMRFDEGFRAGEITHRCTGPAGAVSCYSMAGVSSGIPGTSYLFRA